ncbi:HET-s/LopB domain protein [Aspergillus taichungensis]|uniref:HET-s/LopB domain protein n=1 Tax=Aspergillus taichungensis TaxID=482145 RepID=A0A2J5I3L0_9EURO|nr:HET-s/LopB domain protein [Aspergillus taichungensis]
MVPDPLSLVLSLAGTLDVCIRTGKKLVHLCQQIRSLGSDIEEMALIIEGVWNKMEIQVGLIKEFWNSSLLQPSLQKHYADAILRLIKKLQGAVSSLETSNEKRLSSSSVLAKVKAVYLMHVLKKIVADLETWQRRFDPSWYLITLLSAPAIDERLQQQRSSPSASRLLRIRESIHHNSNCGANVDDSIFQSFEGLSGQRDRIQGTNTYTSYYRGQKVLLDRTDYGPRAKPETIKGHVRDMARMLGYVDADSFGLLKCLGAIEIHPQDSTGAPRSIQYEYVLQISEGLSEPRTLRDVLLTQPTLSLTKRLKLAKQLARSVMFVHTMGFVHKNIRPETVVIFEGHDAGIGPSFLVGFECIRYELGQTDLMGDLEWQKNLYRHPHRQGLWTEEAYTMQHDIYSLGVCLLEIALWHSFVICEPDKIEPHPWSGLKIQSLIAARNQRQDAMAIKEELVTMTQGGIQSLVGDQYTQIVLACLCCLDPNSEHNIFKKSRDDATIESGVRVGVRYIEKILSKIEELSI